MDLSAWQYALILIGSGALSIGFTPLALRVALARQVLDRPGGYKSQASAVPYLGGAAIVGSFTIVSLCAAAILWPSSYRGGVAELGVILGLAVVLAVVGLLDDLRSLNPWPRFAVAVGAGLIVWLTGTQILLFDNVLLDGALTVLWIVGITNALNLLDNMDGLSAGISAIASFFFFLIAAINGQVAIAALSIALAGCAIGFLWHNFHPARIYMGDAGSLFLGFLLAVIGIRLRFSGPTNVTFMVPILVMGVPILDTTLVVMTRILRRRNPLAGGRDHISHRLVFLGISVPGAVALIYGSGVALGWLGLVMSRIDVTSGLLLMSLVLVVSLFLLVILGSIPVHGNSRRKRMMVMQTVAHEEPPDVPIEQANSAVR